MITSQNQPGLPDFSETLTENNKTREGLDMRLTFCAQNYYYYVIVGFAVNLHLLLSKPDARINPDALRGNLESSILEKLITGMEELEAKADNCKKVSLVGD